MRERWTSLVVFVKRAEEWDLFSCIRGEPSPPLYLLFVQSYHMCILLTLGSPVRGGGDSDPLKACYVRDRRTSTPGREDMRNKARFGVASVPPQGVMK